MKQDIFENLEPTVQLSLLIAMYLRHEMEDFHCTHLTDEQIKELNPLIRQALYNILRYLKIAHKEKNDRDKTQAKSLINFLSRSIPDYWELPTEEAFRKDFGKLN